MGCELVPLPGGGNAIVCGTKPRCNCGRRATYLCDWKVPSRKSGTCDANICVRCATSPAEDKHLCTKHAEEYRRWASNRASAGGRH